MPNVEEFTAAGMSDGVPSASEAKEESGIHGGLKEEINALQVCVPVPHCERDPHAQVTIIYACE